MTQELAVYGHNLPNRQEVAAGFQSLREFQKACQENMIHGVDYGAPFPGSDKDSLLKPGAEKICRLAGVYNEYEVLTNETNYDTGLHAVMIRCTLIEITSGVKVTSGIGSCSSFESRYRYRWVYERQLAEHGLDVYSPGLVSRTLNGRGGNAYTQYRVENRDIVDQFNTVDKIAAKRALVDSALGIARLSEIFTQDGDEYRSNDTAPPANNQPAQRSAPAAGPTNAGECQNCGSKCGRRSDGTYFPLCYDCNQNRNTGTGNGQQAAPQGQPQEQPQRAPEPSRRPMEEQQRSKPIEASARPSVWDDLRDEVESDNIITWGDEFAGVVLKMPIQEFVVLNGNDMGTAARNAKGRYDMFKESREGGLGWVDEPDPNA